ncbi:hypothetical protein ACGFYZ_39060 [Streptomyces sp. NPDC048330]|uniref:hypothetical protein n=1 Tax=Streptomyces sp. NPDC048330 TaxID=3365533 RepID=UPI003715AC37
MNTEKRLTTAELVDEIRSSLITANGWIPALSGPNGPIGVLEGAPLSEIARSLDDFANAPTMPSPVAQQLRRAAESAAAAMSAGSDAEYGHLGVAYAYVLQAQRAASETGQ